VDFGDIRVPGLSPVKRHRGGKAGQAHRHGIGDAAAVTKSDDADFAVGSGV